MMYVEMSLGLMVVAAIIALRHQVTYYAELAREGRFLIEQRLSELECRLAAIEALEQQRVIQAPTPAPKGGMSSWN